MLPDAHGIEAESDADVAAEERVPLQHALLPGLDGVRDVDAVVQPM